MDSTVVIILVILVVVLVAGVAAFVVRGTSKREAAREQAQELRSDPVASGAGVHDADLEARRAQDEAARVRREAEQAEARARQAEQGVTVERARQEDHLREADQVDPDVDDRADEYDPSPPVAGPVEPPGAEGDRSGDERRRDS